MAWEWLKKYLTGNQRTMLNEDEERVLYNTQGLFGTGGNFGQGGLLTNFQKPENPGEGLLNIFSNLPVATGFEIAQSGVKGEPIETSLLPSFKKGLVTTSAVEKVKASKRKRDYINKYKNKVPKEDMELFLAFPEKYITAMLSKEFAAPSLSKEALALYQIARTKGTGDDFKEWFKTLPKADQDLYNKQIRPNISRLEAILSAGIDKRDKLKEVRNPTDSELKTLKEANPGKSDKELIKWFRDNWESISANL